MNKNSRLKNSIKNMQVALLFYLLNLILQFFFRKIFIDYLGAELLGLNTTAMNLLQFLNIAELGVGAAVSYSLYKPLAVKDHQNINEIISVQGYLYNRIGFIILISGFVLLFFFPLIFSGMKLPLWYAYSTFGVLFLSSLASYFFNYQQILLVSDQKEYQLNYILQGVKLFKVLFQILSIFYFTNGYYWWIFWEVVAIFIITFGIKHILKKEYPWLNTNITNGKLVLEKHKEITLKTKQLFAHKLAGFALNESTPLIIFAFTSLSFIAVYGNYLLVIAGITALLSAVFNSVNAGVGNLVSENNFNKIELVFEELFTVRFFFAIVSCYCVYKLSPIFITFWVGSKFVLDNSTLILLVVLMFINITRLTVDTFLNAYGLFKDVAAPIIELIINITFSILLGKLYGINGILVGVIFSMSLVVFCWKPFFLFNKGMNTNSKKYFKMFIKQIIIAIIVIFISEHISLNINLDPYKSIPSFLMYSFFILLLISIQLFVFFLLLTNGMNLFISRIKNLKYLK
jgi:O-antigen/teichoic acid export membrane protein